VSFVAAAFLAGLLALGVPWWLHRRETRSAEQRAVSSLFLMRPGQAAERSRKVLQHRWLLTLRLLLLAVLVLAFAQPVLERAFNPASGAAATLPRLVVLDTSLSMSGAFAEARRIAHDLIDAMPAGGGAAVVGVADELTVAAAVSSDRGVLHAAVNAVQPGTARLPFDGLLARLMALAGTLVDGTVEVHLISDFQLSAMPAQFNGLVSGARGPLVLHPVSAEPANWYVEHIGAADQVAVSVAGRSTPARQLDVVVSAAGGELGRRPLAVPAGGRATATFPRLPTGAGDAWLRAAIVGAGDTVALDDTGYQVLRRSATVPLPVFTSPGAAAHLDYLGAAVSAGAARFRPAPPESSGPVAVVVDPGELGADRLRLLERHLQGGGAVLMTVGPATQGAGRLPLGGQRLAATGFEHKPRGVVAADRSHPLLTGFDVWREVTVSRHLATAGAVTGAVLLTLDDGTPLLFEQRLAAGRALVLMTALDPGWSTLVTRPAFVSFIAAALSYLAEDTLPAAAVAGQPLAIPAASAQLFDRSGNRLLSLDATVGHPIVRLHDPGIYTLRTPSQQRLLAVNADLRESDLGPSDPVLLERWQAASRAVPVQPTLAGAGSGEHRVPLAPWLLALLGLLAVLEPVTANAARRGAL
jgi:hypothetical protein